MKKIHNNIIIIICKQNIFESIILIIRLIKRKPNRIKKIKSITIPTLTGINMYPWNFMNFQKKYLSKNNF